MTTVWTSPQDGTEFTKEELIQTALFQAFGITEDMVICLGHKLTTFEEWLDFACHLWKDGCDTKTEWHALYELDEKAATLTLELAWHNS